MEWVEVRAENIEAAEELALDQLGVAREDAEFEVVTREENRLFGLKKTEARVRARVKPADLPSKTTNSNRKRSKNNNKSQKGSKSAPKNNKNKTIICKYLSGFPETVDPIVKCISSFFIVSIPITACSCW